MDYTARLILEERSSAGRSPRIIDGQRVEVRKEADTHRTGVDGRLSVGSHPAEVIWRGGKAKELHGVTHVQILGTHGDVLLAGELNTHYGPPRDIEEGVSFYVL